MRRQLGFLLRKVYRPTERKKEAVHAPKRKEEEDMPTPAPVPERKKKPTVATVLATTRLGFPSLEALEGGSGGGGHDMTVVVG